MEQNLPELRDIHLPEGVSGISAGLRLVGDFRRYPFAVVADRTVFDCPPQKQKRYALYLLAHVRQENAVAAALQMSEILRRICVYKYKEAAALYGQPWLDFLNRYAKIKLEGASARLLLDAPYMNPASPAMPRRTWKRCAVSVPAG